MTLQFQAESGIEQGDFPIRKYRMIYRLSHQLFSPLPKSLSLGRGTLNLAPLLPGEKGLGDAG